MSKKSSIYPGEKCTDSWLARCCLLQPPAEVSPGSSEGHRLSYTRCNLCCHLSLLQGVTPPLCSASLQVGSRRAGLCFRLHLTVSRAPCSKHLSVGAGMRLLDYEGFGQRAGSYSPVPRSSPVQEIDHGVGAEKEPWCGLIYIPTQPVLPGADT